MSDALELFGGEYGKIVFEKDDWYLLRRPERAMNTVTNHWFWHLCPRQRPKDSMPWLVDYFGYDSSSKKLKPIKNWHPSWRCCSCWHEAPDEIVGVYVLLESEYAGPRMNAVLTAWENETDVPSKY